MFVSYVLLIWSLPVLINYYLIPFYFITQRFGTCDELVCMHVSTCLHAHANVEWVIEASSGTSGTIHTDSNLSVRSVVNFQAEK
jgi:hypothetical protein